MICIIRISGQVGMNHKVKETFKRMGLWRKYTCTVINPTKEKIGMLNKIRHHVAFGEINNQTFEEIITNRGKAIDKKKKIDVKKAAEGIAKGSKYEEFNLKPFFRLHSPRKGIKSKKNFPKGVLGNHKDKINELVMRML